MRRAGNAVVDDSNTYSFSYMVESYSHRLTEYPEHASITIPLAVFSQASCFQAVARYVVDEAGFSFAEAGRLLGRSGKSVWGSYHQTGPLEPVPEEGLRIPITVFTAGLPALEALVLHLKGVGFRNAEIARMLGLDPRTTHTAARRGEARR